MTAYFAIDYDARARFLRLELRKLWDRPTLDAFTVQVTQIRDEVERLGFREDTGRILLDLTEFAVQPKAIAESLGQLLPRLGERAGRVAVVNSASAIQNLQVHRLLSAEKVRTFSTLKEAELWLSQG